jgi:hypothetical protein
MRTLVLLALVQLVTATGCLAVSTLEHEPTPTPQLTDRDDCGEILGTAFHSEHEQAWFAENCSGWADATLGRVEPVEASPTASPRPAATPTPEPTPDGASDRRRDRSSSDDRRSRPTESDGDASRCARMQGQPYESAADREWFLDNCIQQEVVPGEPARCAEIRGRPYQSRAQRAWFLRNCTASPSVREDPDPDGPDRQDCDQIRGTQYRSSSERSWFLRNCTGR